MRRGGLMNTENNNQNPQIQTENPTPVSRTAEELEDDFIEKWCDMQFKKHDKLLRMLTEAENREKAEALAKKKESEEG